MNFQVTRTDAFQWSTESRVDKRKKKASDIEEKRKAIFMVQESREAFKQLSGAPLRDIAINSSDEKKRNEAFVVQQKRDAFSRSSKNFHLKIPEKVHRSIAPNGLNKNPEDLIANLSLATRRYQKGDVSTVELENISKYAKVLMQKMLEGSDGIRFLSTLLAMKNSVKNQEIRFEEVAQYVRKKDAVASAVVRFFTPIFMDGMGNHPICCALVSKINNDKVIEAQIKCMLYERVDGIIERVDQLSKNFIGNLLNL